MKAPLVFLLVVACASYTLGQNSHADTLKKIAYLDEKITGISRQEIEPDLKIDNVFDKIENKPSSINNQAIIGMNLQIQGFDDNKSNGQKRVILDEFLTQPYVDSLITLLRIRDQAFPQDKIEAYLDQIRYYETIFRVYEKLRKGIKDGSEISLANREKNIKRFKSHMELVAYQYEFLLGQEYSLFRNTDVSKQLIKGINIYHDNDFLFIYPLNKLNYDRDYTGGIKIEITTDQLKMRFLSEIFEDSKVFNNSNILSYQSLFFGVEAYTPYIRFGQEEASLRDSVYNVDRPFASFQYFGRSKFRLHYTGKWRLRNDTKIGWIGKSLAQKGQDILHRDITIASVHVEKWDEQIGGGGRLAINFDYMLDLMLYSADGDMFKPNRQYSKGPYDRHQNRSFHLYAPVEVHAGNQYTGAALGLGLSNHSFKDRSGGYDFITPSHRMKEKNSQFGKWLQHAIFLSWETRVKYVVHNSMLQGIGWFRTSESDKDGLDDEFESKRKLIPFIQPDNGLPTHNFNPKNGRMNKWIANMDFSIALKQKKTTLFLTYSFNTREFRYDDEEVRTVVAMANSIHALGNSGSKTWNQQRIDNKEQKKFAQNEITYGLLNGQIRGFGRVGLNFQF